MQSFSCLAHILSIIVNSREKKRDRENNSIIKLRSLAIEWIEIKERWNDEKSTDAGDFN